MNPTRDDMKLYIRGEADLCLGCPPIGYPTDKTRCLPCPRRQVIRGEADISPLEKANDGYMFGVGADTPMKRAVKMCESCPFRLKMSRAERAELAALSPDEFPCHTEAGYTWTDIQCRGHWEARRAAIRNP